MKKLIGILFLAIVFVAAQQALIAQEKPGKKPEKIEKKGEMLQKKGEKLEKKGEKVEKKGR